MTWHSLRILLLTTPPEPNLDAIAAAALDAIVLQSPVQFVPVASIAATRPEVPLIVLADVDAEVSPRLIAAGADEVLPLGTSMTDIVRAVQHALARKQRAHGPGSGEPPVSADMRPIPPQLEAIGRLAGGVAQDFNNLLMIIEGNAERLLSALPGEDPQRGRVAAISTAAAPRRGPHAEAARIRTASAGRVDARRPQRDHHRQRPAAPAPARSRDPVRDTPGQGPPTGPRGSHADGADAVEPGAHCGRRDAGGRHVHGHHRHDRRGCGLAPHAAVAAGGTLRAPQVLGLGQRDRRGFAAARVRAVLRAARVTRRWPRPAVGVRAGQAERRVHLDRQRPSARARTSPSCCRRLASKRSRPTPTRRRSLHTSCWWKTRRKCASC